MMKMPAGEQSYDSPRLDGAARAQTKRTPKHPQVTTMSVLSDSRVFSHRLVDLVDFSNKFVLVSSFGT